jgi:hypothetical protein
MVFWQRTQARGRGRNRPRTPPRAESVACPPPICFAGSRHSTSGEHGRRKGYKRGPEVRMSKRQIRADYHARSGGSQRNRGVPSFARILVERFHEFESCEVVDLPTGRDDLLHARYQKRFTDAGDAAECFYRTEARIACGKYDQSPPSVVCAGFRLSSTIRSDHVLLCSEMAASSGPSWSCLNENPAPHGSPYARQKMVPLRRGNTAFCWLFARF